MTIIRHRVRAFSFEPKDPPAELQLWNAGDNPTDYGVHKWTARSVAEVGGRYESRGNPLLIDVEHNGATVEDGEPAITGGYARLELRAGEPWLVFDWSAYAVEQIRTGQRRFLSPEYDVDRTTGEILALYRVSLVADPGTHRARMLAAAALKENRSMDPKLAAIMAILGSVSDPAAAIESIKSLVANLDGTAPSAPESGGELEAGADDAATGEGGDKAPPFEKKASADDKPADDKSADKPADKMAAAAPAPAAGDAAPAVNASAITAAAAAAVLQIEEAQRDHLLATQGDRLEPSIRRWASSQPFAVVRGLVGAAPAKIEPADRVAATRGATQGGEAGPKGLEGAELEALNRAMGTHKAAVPVVHEKAGALVLPTVPPSVHRERLRAAAAVDAGKAGK